MLFTCKTNITILFFVESNYKLVIVDEEQPGQWTCISTSQCNFHSAVLLELVVKLVHIYGLGEKTIRCLLTHSCMLQLLQLLLFEQLYISQKGQIPLRSTCISCRHVHG